MITPFHIVHKHFQQHHKKYLFGIFGSFAVVKMFVLLFGLVSGLIAFQHTTHAAYESFCSDNSGSINIPVTECEALISLYNATDGGNWMDSDGWGIDTEICTGWFGITCSNDNINQLNLSNNNLVGAIPTQIGDLTGLNHINFNGNRITSLPTNIGNLSGLLWLDIENNLLTYIPESVGQLYNLQSLNMDFNRIFSLPESIVTLTSLTTINVSDNNLSTLPASFTQLTALTKGSISGNCIDDSSLSPSMIAFLDSKGIAYDNQKIGCITHQDSLVVQLIREGSTNSVVSGDSITYIIHYQNNGTATTTGAQVSLILPKSLPIISTEGSPSSEDIPGATYGPDRRMYGVTGDMCREDMMQETGIYIDGIMQNFELDTLTGLQSLLSDMAPEFSAPPYNGQLDQIGEFMTYGVMSPEFVPFYAILGMINIDSITLTGCGTQPTTKYTRDVGNLSVNESGNISFSVQATNHTIATETIIGIFTGEGKLPLPPFSRDNNDADLSLTYTNTSTDQSVGFRLNRDDLPLMTSNQSILSGIITVGMTEKEKAIALREFVYKTSINDAALQEYPNTNGMTFTPVSDRLNPVRYLNSLYGLCGHINGTLGTLAQLAGLETRQVSFQLAGGGGHTITEINIDGQWGMFDADGGSYYEDPNDHHIYSVQELGEDTSRITATPLYNYYLDGNFIELITSATRTYFSGTDSIREPNITFALSLLPQDTLQYTYSLIAHNIFERHKRYEVGRGKLTRHLFSPIYISEEVLGVTGQTTTGFLFDESMPYLVTNIDIIRHDSIQKNISTSISFDGGHSWEAIGNLRDRLVYDLNPFGEREDNYGYTLRFICDDCITSDMTDIIFQTTIQNDFYFNALALPTTGLDLYLTHKDGFSGVSLTWNKNSIKLHTSITGSLLSNENTLNNTDMVELNVFLPQPKCNNGILESGELCDDSKLNGTVGYCTTTCDGIVPKPQQPSGGGGGSTFFKDQCPATRDCSDSYYDKICGKCPTAITGMIHEAAPNCTAYTPELNTAYSFAFSHTITTIDDCTKANLTGDLIRSHMAKMIVNFSINVMNKVPNTGIVCTFADMQHESVEMQGYAKLACQLGLMGLESDGIHPSKNFNPQTTIDRAQFGTILSRLLRGNTNNGGYPYYLKHLQALHTEGIMTKIDTPLISELRGRVMVMMQRISEKK